MSSLRLTPETRDQLMSVAASDYDGATADATIRALLEEHWRLRAVEAMDSFRLDHPDEWANAVTSADASDQNLAASLHDDPWEPAS
jgi:hypothetical protein